MSSMLWHMCAVRTAPYWQVSSCGSSGTRRLKPHYSGHSMTERLAWRVGVTAIVIQGHRKLRHLNRLDLKNYERIISLKAISDNHVA